MKTKLSTLLMIMSLAVLFTGCESKNEAASQKLDKVYSSSNAQSVKSGNTCSGSVIFAELPDEVDCLRYHAFDETTVDITDRDIIDNFINNLKENNYVQLDKDEYVEGFYSFTLISGNETVSVGVGGETVAIDWGQYQLQGNDVLITDELKKACKIG